MKFLNESGLVNFVFIVFELGDKMLTLSSMENLIVQCNLKACGIVDVMKNQNDPRMALNNVTLYGKNPRPCDM